MTTVKISAPSVKSFHCASEAECADIFVLTKHRLTGADMSGSNLLAYDLILIGGGTLLARRLSGEFFLAHM
jgi:hypothetical protein